MRKKYSNFSTHDFIRILGAKFKKKIFIKSYFLSSPFQTAYLMLSYMKCIHFTWKLEIYKFVKSEDHEHE